MSGEIDHLIESECKKDLMDLGFDLINLEEFNTNHTEGFKSLIKFDELIYDYWCFATDPNHGDYTPIRTLKQRLVDYELTGTLNLKEK